MTRMPSADATDEPIVAVCSQGANCLALFTLADGTARGTIPVGDHPVHATVVGERVFVATMGERSIDAIDDGDVVRIDLGVLGPSHFALAADQLFVPCTGGDVVACVDPRTRECTSRIPTGTEPHDIAATDGRVYVGSRADGLVTVIDASRAEPVGELRFSEEARIQGVEVHPASSTGYAIDQRNARIHAFALGDDPTVIATAPVGNDPYDLFIHGDRVYVPGRGDGTVSSFALDLGDARTLDGFARPTAVAASGTSCWVVDRDAACLTSLDGDVCTTPAGAIAAHPTPQGLLLSHYDDASVSLVDPDAGLRWHQPAPEHPFGAMVI